MEGSSAWVDGRFVAAGVAAVAAHDAGFQSGVGVFETMGARGGALPLWPAHLARLAHGAQRLGLDPTPPDALRAAAEELLRRERQPDGIVRLTLTAGVAGRATWCLTTRPRRDLGRAVCLHPVSVPRAASDPLASIKCTSRALWVWADAQAHAAGADQALLVDDHGRVLETSTGNVFAHVRGDWCTPRADGALLPGIARALLLERSVVRESDLRLADLEAAAALAVSNAVYGPRAATLARDPAGGIDILVRAWREALAARH